MLLPFSNEMTLRACWETGAISDSLVPHCWVLQGKLVCSTQGFKIALPTQCLDHQQAESCWHTVVVVTGINVPGLLEESRHLQAVQLLSFQAASPVHHTSLVTFYEHNEEVPPPLHILPWCISHQHGPRTKPSTTALHPGRRVVQGAHRHYIDASEGKTINLGLSCCREVLKQTPLGCC